MAKMKAKQRNALPKKVFGIPAKRKFPLNDEAHVKAAVRLFGRASDEDKPALARKILSRAKTLGMDSSGWKTIHEWASKSSTVKESALIGFEHYFEESNELIIPDEDITIRKATKDDLDFIVEMELSTFSEKTKASYPGIPEYCKRDAKKYLDSTEIIMDDDERIGIYMAYMDGDAWFISSIALLPEYQNRGIGSALIQHDIDTHEKIQLYVDIYNDKAKKLYEKLGFRVIEHDDDHWIMELDKTNNIKLVDATKDDIDYIYECELQTVSSDEKKDPDFRKEVRKDVEDSVGHTKIIMLNNTRVGIYQAYATNKWGLEEGEKNWWYIAEIYLDPSARGNGIGTSIIETDISNHDKLLLNVLKENKKAIKLYKRLGFKIDKEFDNRYIMRLVKSTIQEYSDVVFETVNVGQMNPEQKKRHDERQMHRTEIKNARKLGYDSNEKQRVSQQRQFAEKRKREFEQEIIESKKYISQYESKIAQLKTNPDNLDPATLKSRIARLERGKAAAEKDLKWVEHHIRKHPDMFEAGETIGSGTVVDAFGRKHDYDAKASDFASYTKGHVTYEKPRTSHHDLGISTADLQGRDDFDVTLNHEVGHMAQYEHKRLVNEPHPVEEYVLSCAKAFIEKNRSMMNDHDADKYELHADYLSARKVGFNRVYKNIIGFYSKLGYDENDPNVISSKYRALFIRDMMWLHKGRPDRCSMKYPAWTPEVKKAFMEYFVDDTDECIQEEVFPWDIQEPLVKKEMNFFGKKYEVETWYIGNEVDTDDPYHMDGDDWKNLMNLYTSIEEIFKHTDVESELVDWLHDMDYFPDSEYSEDLSREEEKKHRDEDSKHPFDTLKPNLICINPNDDSIYYKYLIDCNWSYDIEHGYGFLVSKDLSNCIGCPQIGGTNWENQKLIPPRKHVQESFVDKDVDLTVSYIKKAIKKIHDKTEKDSKPPTGNQNCQICTWCLEAQCRGIDALPRAIYSPRDKGLAIYGPSIVIDPYKIRITDRDDVYNTVRKAGKGARFWVHVNWNQSTGGHEFMLINIDSKTYIADAQAGSLIEFGPKPKDVETSRTTKDYFYEINFAHSYIVRLDNKKLNEKILDEATDESKTLPWDEKKDIEYMRKEGMLTGEEDEEYAKKTGLITEAASDMIKVDNFKYNKVYYGAIQSGEKHRKLSSPLFVTPYIGIASIFAGREKLWPELRKRGVVGETNLDYDEWRLPEKDLHRIFKTIHVTVQVPSSNTACKTDVEPFEIKLKGYIHTVDTTDLKNDIYQYKWMDKTREYLIDVPEIDIENVEEIETRYIVTVKRMTKEQNERYQSRHKSKHVQEQVIPDAINDMIPILKSSEYGIGYKGKLITDPTNADYNEKWHCLSPEEFLEYHGGVCYDYVEWEADYLKKHDIKFKKFHISYHVDFDKNDPGEDASTHSICVAIVDGKYIYIEGSNKRLAKKMNYVKEFDDLDKLLDFAVENMQHDSKQNKLMIIDYTNVKGFIGWNMFGYQGKIFSEGKVIRSDFTQEQYIGESYRDEHHNKLYFHLSPDSYLDGQVFKPRVPEYLDRYDPEDKNFENDTTPRVCFSPSIEGCLNGIQVNLPRVNVMPAKSTRFYVYTPEKPFHEYKHKTNKELIRDKDIFDASVTQEVWILEPVRMKLYGVIEIDSVTNVKRKQNVPTASGKKSDRPYYKYKWHWLVKPKVLEKGTRFDYSVPRVIENLCMELPKFRYGLIRDGRLQTGNVSESDYDKYWVVHSPEEIDEAGGGNCWDMVEWEAGYLESYGVKYNKYFLSMEHNKKIRTHTFIVVKDHGKFIYIEQAFKRVVDEIGNSKEFDKLEDIFDYVIEASMEFDNMKECNYGIWDYTDIKFKVGTPAKNFMDYIITNGENVYEGNKSNRKKDDFK